MNLLIKTIAQNDELYILRTALDFQRTLVGLPNISDQDFKNAQKLAGELFADIQHNLRPWAAAKGKQQQQAQIDTLIRAYKTHLGDPSDPVFRAKLEQDAQMQRQRAMEKPRETEVQRIDRLIRERDEDRKRRA